jgi:hypothetical protein
MIGFIDTLYIQLWTTRNYSAVADLHALQFTVTHALGFPAFTSRILATDLQQSHCNFKSHIKSSLHSLIPFLPFLLNHLRLPSPELDPVLFLCSQAHILAGWRLETRLTLLSRTLHYNHFARITHKTQPLYCWEGVFIALLHSMLYPAPGINVVFQ